MPEFTGERVIPGLVDNDLLNEHLARYRFAERFPGAAALDVGCGTGYGTRDIGIDLSGEAIAYARANFPAARFLQANGEAMPFADASFDLVTAFEVIEHLDRWPELLNEANRVLKPKGILLVSTPNKAYYSEMRAKTGPNPFHRHEFEYAEFEAALYAVFPHVRIWAQNHADTIVFAPLNPASVALEAQGDPHPENAHFFLAACSRTEIEYAGLFAWLPASANVLRERERHIARLEGELVQKDEWLAGLKSDHAALHHGARSRAGRREGAHLWAEHVNQELTQRDQRILELQEEAEERLAWTRGLEAQIATASTEVERLQVEVEARTDWARSIEAQLEIRTEHVLLQQRELEELAACRKEIALARERLSSLEAERALLARSKWIRLGRSLNLGPNL